MNKKRRKEIENNIGSLKTIKSNLEDILAAEEDYFDNMPENLQGSIRGEVSEEAIDTLSEAVEAIEEAIDALNEII